MLSYSSSSSDFLSNKTKGIPGVHRLGVNQRVAKSPHISLVPRIYVTQKA